MPVDRIQRRYHEFTHVRDRNATPRNVSERIALILLSLCSRSRCWRKAAARRLRPKARSSSWADEIIKQEGYVTPPLELAAAVMAPRSQNINLSSASPDKKWFLNQINDGPVVMKTFSKPFDELGGVFIDFKANRARSLTISNNVGIQIISAADGSKKPIQIPAGARVSNATWSPDSKSIAYFVHGERCDSHLDHGCRDEQVAAAHEDSGAGHAQLGSFDFTDDGTQIAVVLIPDGRAPMPVKPDCSDRAGSQAHRHRQEPAAHLPEPDDDAV